MVVLTFNFHISALLLVSFGVNARPLTLHAAIYVPYYYRKTRPFSQLKKGIVDSKIKGMEMTNEQIIIIAIAACALVAIFIVMGIVKNTHKNTIKAEIDDLYVRFNKIKTMPIAFKLSKAQAMAKRSEETSASVEEYYKKYEETEKKINEIQEKLNNVDDEANTKKYKETMKAIKDTGDSIAECEKQISDIDEFLGEFAKKEEKQREFSANLKEKYRVVKNTINENASLLSIAFSGFEERLQQCEDLFSSSEEWIYASDFTAAQNDLDKINEILDKIKVDANAVPKCVKDIKGVLPVMLDEARRELALTRQRGVYVSHLDVEKKLDEIDTILKSDTKLVMSGETGNVKEHCRSAKDTLNTLIESLAAENRSYKEAKETNDRAYEHALELEKVENYVRVAYDKDSKRFGLEDLKPMLKDVRSRIEVYKQRYQAISEEIASSIKPSSELLVDAEKLCSDIEADEKSLYSYKTTIDKSTDGETRASSQLTKLQLVISEVESKLAEYHLPTISSSYADDLEKSRSYIDKIRVLISEVPINIEVLNATLDESIDFIYTFYNNVNNIVGMAIMVENAIVFGNKYRSSFTEIDHELSKAEFQYLNGEYTKALKTAITCMETLFPDNADIKILENA